MTSAAKAVEKTCPMLNPHTEHLWDIEDRGTLRYRCPGLNSEQYQRAVIVDDAAKEIAFLLRQPGPSRIDDRAQAIARRLEDRRLLAQPSLDRHRVAAAPQGRQRP